MDVERAKVKAEARTKRRQVTASFCGFFFSMFDQLTNVFVRRSQRQAIASALKQRAETDTIHGTILFGLIRFFCVRLHSANLFSTKSVLGGDWSLVRAIYAHHDAVGTIVFTRHTIQLGTFNIEFRISIGAEAHEESRQVLDFVKLFVAALPRLYSLYGATVNSLFCVCFSLLFPCEKKN